MSTLAFILGAIDLILALFFHVKFSVTILLSIVGIILSLAIILNPGQSKRKNPLIIAGLLLSMVSVEVVLIRAFPYVNGGIHILGFGLVWGVICYFLIVRKTISQKTEKMASNTTYCATCGCELPVDANFCNHCGAVQNHEHSRIIGSQEDRFSILGWLILVPVGLILYLLSFSTAFLINVIGNFFIVPMPDIVFIVENLKWIAGMTLYIIWIFYCKKSKQLRAAFPQNPMLRKMDSINS